MIIHVADSRYLADGQFELTFNDGRRGVVDLRGVLSGPAPEYLYFLAFRNDPALSDLFHQWGYLQEHSAALR
jgi:hypothetical protein